MARSGSWLSIWAGCVLFLASTYGHFLLFPGHCSISCLSVAVWIPLASKWLVVFSAVIRGLSSFPLVLSRRPGLRLYDPVFKAAVGLRPRTPPAFGVLFHRRAVRVLSFQHFFLSSRAVWFLLPRRRCVPLLVAAGSSCRWPPAVPRGGGGMARIGTSPVGPCLSAPLLFPPSLWRSRS